MPIETLLIFDMETTPEPVRAVQVTDDNLDKIAAWVGATSINEYRNLDTGIQTITFNRERQGDLSVQIGYWIVYKDSPRVFDKYRVYPDEDFKQFFRAPTSGTEVSYGQEG